MDLPLPRLPGRHQFANAAAAIAAVKAAGFDIGHAAAERAMRSVDWPGRMQRLPQGTLTELAPAGRRDLARRRPQSRRRRWSIAEAMAEQEERIPRPLFLIAA